MAYTENKELPGLDELTLVNGMMIMPIYDYATGKIYHVRVSNLIPSIDEVPDAWDDSITYPEGAIVSFSGQVYVSAQNGNINKIPSESNIPTWWTLAVSQSNSGMVEWEPGIYNGDTVVVIYNDIFYKLTVPTPYNSTDIDAEILEGDWIALGSGGGGVWGAISGDINDQTDLIEMVVNEVNNGIDVIRDGVDPVADTLAKLYDLMVSLGEFAGDHDASTGALPTVGSGIAGAIDKGDYWYVTTAGTITGFATMNIGDVIFARVANAGAPSQFFYLPFSSIVPSASPTTSGIAKLYNDFSGNNTDGSVTQDAIKSKLVRVVQFAVSDETTPLVAGVGKISFRMPYAMTVTSVRASLSTTQTSGIILTVDINKNGSSILSTKITIDNGEKTSTTAAIQPVISDASLTDDAEITVDIDQLGDGTAKGLKISIIGL